MTPIRRRLLYIFRGDLLRLRVSWHGKALTLSTGHHIDRSRWDGSRCGRNSLHGPGRTPAATINKMLENLERRIDEAFLSFETADTMPTPAQLKGRLSPDAASASVADLFLRFITEGERERMWAFNTIRGLRSLRNLLSEFRPGLRVTDISPEIMREFAVWQQTHRLSPHSFKTGHKGYANSVIRKNCAMFRWFIKWAVAKGLASRSALDGLSVPVKAIGKPVVYLTWDELRRLEGHPYPEGSEKDRARDFFVFCAFSSLRFSDAHALMKTDVSADAITVNAIKTGMRLVIDLNTHTRRILAKYAGSDSPRALPSVTLNRLNHLLKEMGAELGFDTPVTVAQYYGPNRISRTVPKHELLASHCARRTFIVNALSMGIAPNIVMKWTGHSEYSAMRPYIDIADDIRSSEMSKFDR